MGTEALLNFVTERERIRIKKEAGQPWPWTNDPILRDYKFCCTRREDDRVTKGIAAVYREPYKNDPELWFALLVARRAVNWPDTLRELGYPVPWSPEHFKGVIRSRQAARHKAFEAQAYKVMVSGQAGEQADLIVSKVLTPIWEKRDFYRPRPGDTLSSFAARLSEGPYMGGFYAGQVVADLKYAQLQGAPDWWTFAVSGPGSRRGLDRVLGRTPRKYWAEAAWYTEFRQLCDDVREPIRQATGLNLHAQDIQGCLCEYDKLCRLRNGEGERSVRRYKFSQTAAQLEQLSPDDSDSTPNEQKSKLENSIPNLGAEMNREEIIKKRLDEYKDWDSNEKRVALGLKPFSPSEQERLRAWRERSVTKDVDWEIRMAPYRSKWLKEKNEYLSRSKAAPYKTRLKPLYEGYEKLDDNPGPERIAVVYERVMAAYPERKRWHPESTHAFLQMQGWSDQEIIDGVWKCYSVDSQDR